MSQELSKSNVASPAGQRLGAGRSLPAIDRRNARSCPAWQAQRWYQKLRNLDGLHGSGITRWQRYRGKALPSNQKARSPSATNEAEGVSKQWALGHSRRLCLRERKNCDLLRWFRLPRGQRHSRARRAEAKRTASARLGCPNVLGQHDSEISGAL